jgi:hypothetical protein
VWNSFRSVGHPCLVQTIDIKNGRFEYKYAPWKLSAYASGTHLSRTWGYPRERVVFYFKTVLTRSVEAGRKQLVIREKITGGRVSAEEALDTMVAKSAAIAVIAGAAGVCHLSTPARYTVNLLHADVFDFDWSFHGQSGQGLREYIGLARPG